MEAGPESEGDGPHCHPHSASPSESALGTCLQTQAEQQQPQREPYSQVQVLWKTLKGNPARLGRAGKAAVLAPIVTSMGEGRWNHSNLRYDY